MERKACRREKIRLMRPKALRRALHKVKLSGEKCCRFIGIQNKPCSIDINCIYICMYHEQN